MSGGNPHGELRSAAGQRLNFETPADCLRTLSHRHHAESGLRLVRGIFHAIEADSVVLHRHHAFAVRMIERNFDVLSAGVLCDVVERFLGDSKERNSTSSAGRRAGSMPRTATAIPVRLEKFLACQSNAAASPWSSSMGGRSSDMTFSIVSIVDSRSAAESSTRARTSSLLYEASSVWRISRLIFRAVRF